MEYEDITPVVQPSGAVYFFDEENDDPVFTIQAPYMEDSGVEDNLSMDIDVSITPTAQGCIYTITPNQDWLSDAARVYPVIIDPTVTINSVTGNIDDVGVNEYNPTTYYEGVDRMYVGSNYDSGKAYESRIYIRFPRAAYIPTSAYIHAAMMYLEHYENDDWQTADNNLLEVYDVGDYNWDPDTMNWNTQKDHIFTNMIDFNYSDASIPYESFNITYLAQEWYNTTASNNGVVVKPRHKDNTKTNRSCIFSSDCSATYQSRRPSIMMQYFNYTPNANITSGGVYFLRNKNSQMYMDAQNAGGHGANVVQFAYRGGNNQRWQVIHMGGGVYRFAPMHNPGLCLTVPNSSDVNGNNLQVQTFYNERTQLFRITSVGDSFWITSVNGADNKVVEVESASDELRAPVQIWENDEVSPQMMWYFDFDDLSGAPSYADIETSSTSINCAGFALQVNEWISYSQLDLPMYSGIPVETLRENTLTYFNNKNNGRIARIPEKDTLPTCALQPGEYRIAVRTGFSPNMVYPDGHYMIQLDTGEWAEKRDDNPSVNLGYINPSTYNWGNYYSQTLYFVVTAA